MTRPPGWAEAHDNADRAGRDHYIDPGSGLLVMTEGFLRRRGTCCASGCRHCPYGSDPNADPAS